MGNLLMFALRFCEKKVLMQMYLSLHIISYLCILDSIFVNGITYLKEIFWLLHSVQNFNSSWKVDNKNN